MNEKQQIFWACMAFATLFLGGAYYWYLSKVGQGMKRFLIVNITAHTQLLVSQENFTPSLTRFKRRHFDVSTTKYTFFPQSDFGTIGNLFELPNPQMVENLRAHCLYIVIASDGATLSCVYEREAKAWRALGPVLEKFL